jgi:NAD(P)H-dependent FMN reductase
MQKEKSSTSAVSRSANAVAEMAKVFREAEDFMIESLFAEHPLSDEMASYLAGKQDAALAAISALLDNEDLELIRHHIREGVL